MRIEIQSKLLVMLLAMALVTALVVGWIGYRSGTQALEQAAYQQVTQVRESRAREVASYFTGLERAVVLNSRTAENSMQAFEAGWRDLAGAQVSADQRAQVEAVYSDVLLPQLAENAGQEFTVESFLPTSDAAWYLQAHYTDPALDYDATLAVDDAGDGSVWSAAHARYHDTLREIVTQNEFEDLLLIDPDGNVVYSAYKGVDLGTNVLSGPYAGGSLEDTFRETVTSNGQDYVGLADFEPYQPLADSPTQFVMSPIQDDGLTVGVLAIQASTDRLNEVLTSGGQWQQAGFGETGETYLVGPDGTLRSTSRLLVENPEEYVDRVVAAGTPRDVAETVVRLGNPILRQSVQSPAIERALDGETGIVRTTGYRDTDVIVAYTPVDAPGLNWVIAAAVDPSEVFAPVQDFQRQLVLSIAGMLLLAAVASLLLAQVFVRPIRSLVSGVRAVSAGDLDAQVRVRTNDEVGDLAEAFNEMATSLRTKQELLEAEQAEKDRILLSLMPPAVAEQVKGGEETIAQDFQDVSVVFADLVGFAGFTSGMDSHAALEHLNELVRAFDEAAERTGVEKVRSLRNGFLASCGLVIPRVDHARRIVQFTSELTEVVAAFNARHGSDLSLRAGINVGTVTSGIVGRASVVYDLWGEAVDLAYRVHAEEPEPGIYVTDRIYDAVRDQYEFTEAGVVRSSDGEHPVWRLDERR
ncbi:adenylate/guanylate cyclase with integral membrane sensor [Beutenbergia cavernae DSM 12333]|uniref:Adenylate/guanylate cyclase with integral membrane sensor n=1 Tax=Beutenbergia cavernae (strain ATCC BAA-8 / DSM 12333 / CCUG 43141 / JCM 11478 / NBRC 16432 / NCIMB 13614 / HKI 0122) TaxID=471853 RepID=C5BVQ0_BEUC1|nr:adenylate/guanylate cyclase domain-containing protein [Beutenbergia cavernae]ACQ78490.1 adenylate/guanylate cyclase with integral membrane sensor [Beutenbergia cavernae DSM 12333]